MTPPELLLFLSGMKAPSDPGASEDDVTKVTVSKVATADPVGTPDGGSVFVIRGSSRLRETHIGWGATLEDAITAFKRKENLPEF